MSRHSDGAADVAVSRGAPLAPEQAMEWVDRHTPALPGETVAVEAAHGRVLAKTVRANLTLPATVVAARNGFAVNAAATSGASGYNPLRLRLCSDGDEPLAAGEARVVASGAPVPAGADAVLPLDEAKVLGSTLEVYGDVAAGEHVQAAGTEATSGDDLLAQGHRLRAHDLAQLAALGLETVSVVRRPRVRLIAAHGGSLPRGDGAGIMLEALVRRDGGAVASRGHALDAETLHRLLEPPGDDLVLVYGGSGDGANDYAAVALARGGALDQHGVAINPGETTGLGHHGPRPLILLPGVPLACLCAYELLAGRAVRRLAGGGGDWPYPLRRATLRRKVASTLGRLELCRVRLEGDAALPLAVSDARLLASAVQADGFVLVPLHSEGYAEGSEVNVHVYQ